MPGQKQKGKKNVRGERNKHYFIEPNLLNNDIVATIEATHGGYPPRFTCKTVDGEEFIAPVQGSIAKGPKREFVKKGMVVLCVPMECDTMTNSSNSIESKKMIIHHIYKAEEVKELERRGYMNKKGIKKDSQQDQVVIGNNTNDNVDEISELDISLI